MNSSFYGLPSGQNDCKLTKGHHHQLTAKPSLCPDCPARQTASDHYDYPVPHHCEIQRCVRNSVYIKITTAYKIWVQHKTDHLNFMRLVQMSAGQKNDTTSLEIAVSVVIAPHHIFVRRAWSE